MSDPREYVMGECGDGSMALCCGWCMCVEPDHMPWCNSQAADTEAIPTPPSAGGCLGTGCGTCAGCLSCTHAEVNISTPRGED